MNHFVKGNHDLRWKRRVKHLALYTVNWVDMVNGHFVPKHVAGTVCGIAGGLYFSSEHMVEFLVRKNLLKQDLQSRPGNVEKRQSVTVTNGVLVIGRPVN